MKRYFVVPYLIALLLIIIPVSLQAQVFDTGQTMKKGKASIGVNPVIYNNGGTDFTLFLHGAYGFRKGSDLGVKLGVGGNETYFGVDVEWVLRRISPYISFSGGAHTFGDIGIDGTLNFTIPVNRQVNLYSGMDTDIVLTKDIQFPLWIFVGVEMGFRKNLNLLLEVEAGINNDAPYNVFGVGFYFYL